MTDMASSEPTSTEMNPMYATILERPPTSDSPPPSFASTRDTTTSDTALLNPYEDPSKDTALRGGQPGGRLDTENAIYGKGSADDKVKEVVRVEHDEHSSKDRLWTCIRSFMCLVLPVLACVFAAAVLIVILLVAFGVLQVAGQRPPAEQLESLSTTLADLQIQLNDIAAQNAAAACPNATSLPLPMTSTMMLQTVNFSACDEFRSSCNFSSDTCVTGINGTAPEFIETGQNAPSVTLGLSCWVSNGEGKTAVFIFANNTLQCQCSGSAAMGPGTGGVCNFYHLTCQVPVVTLTTT